MADIEFMQGGWTKLREPSRKRQVLLAYSFVVLVFLLVPPISKPVTPSMPAFHDGGSAAMLGRLESSNGDVLASVLLLLLPMHELLHVAAFPNKPFGRSSTIGFSTAHGALYVHSDAVISRGRFILALAMPLLIITIAPAFLALAFGWSLRLLSAIAIFNASGAGADVLGIYLLATRVPHGALVQNNGVETWWKLVVPGRLGSGNGPPSLDTRPYVQ